jgi:hypothetical protein
VNIRGGAWTALHTGVAADSFRCEACNAGALRSCELHRLPKSATFSIFKFTESHTQGLATFWGDNMQFWYDEFMDRGGLAPCFFTDDEL